MSLGYRRIIGLDEVGRGALAGPLVVAAVELSIFINDITDSKLLSAAKREILADKIHNLAAQVSFGSVNPEEIDKLGLTAAQKLAYVRALEGVDGDIFLTDYYAIDNKPFIKAVKGDQLFFPVAAASIVAKVQRDKLMHENHKLFPNFGWDKNVGYGTKKHFDGIDKFGLTDLHRKSFISH